MTKKLVFGDEAKEQLLEGAEILFRAVSTTLGPKGQNAVIEAYGEPIVTHDGVTVAKAIDNASDVSHGARVGIEMIKAASSKTNDNVGDGTTSSTIVAYHLMKEGMEKIKGGKMNSMTLRRQLDEAAQEALAILPELATPLTTEKETIEVATISCENPVIGEAIGKMYHKLGKDAMVVVELGSKPEIEYEIVEGYTFDRGMFSPMFVTDSRTQTTTVKNPAILIAHQTIGTKDVAQLVGEVYNAGKDSLIIIASDFKTEFIDNISIDTDLQIVPVKAPGFGDQRIELMKDLAAFTGTEAVGDKLPKNADALKPDQLGTCEEIVVSLEETVLTGGKDVADYIAALTSKLNQSKGDFDKTKIEKRIAQLRAQVGYIRVGGNTEMEAEERKYLVDDAVAATEAALKEGIVPGGGTTYIEIANRLQGLSEGHSLLKEALLAPFKVLMTNAGERYGKKLEELKEFGTGFDVMGDGSLVNLKEHGVIDPALVIKQTITNATSVAGSALTTGVIISHEKEDKKNDED